jgi:8-amino-7-oxononanoate synthase
VRDLGAELRQLRECHRSRSRRLADSAQGPRMTIDGRDCLVFCSNDYLGLANHPRVVEALRRTAAEQGVGAGAAHLINGHHREHHLLEEELAAFTGRDRALLFSTGYMANLAVGSALLGRRDSAFEDRLNHASLLDAARLAGCRLRRYRHAETGHLRELLAARGAGGRLVLTDGVFSMDGDIAPLAELAAVARDGGAWLVVDDAHGLGVLGPDGAGSVAAAGLDQDAVPVLVGTLGKAFGTAGAFVAGSGTLVEYLLQRARTYIYTTASPPAVAAATRASLRLSVEEGWRRQRLRDLVCRFRQGAGQLGLSLSDSDTPIQPILLGTEQRVLQVGEQLWQRGLLVGTIRPPTVPEGTARLRITLSAAHGEAQVDELLDGLAVALGS